MIKKLLLSAIILLPASLHAQNLNQNTSPVNLPEYKEARFSGFAAAACGNDTVLYPLAKALSASLYTLVGNGGTGFGEGFGQYYTAPQPLTVHGFEFYGRGKNNAVTVNVRLYSASPIDSTPVAQLATTTATLTTVATPTLTNMYRVANFTTPVTVTGPYLLVVEGVTTSTDTFQLVTNGNGNGGSERLSKVRLGGTLWMDVQDAYGSDVDFLAHPIVNYNLNSNFTSSGNTCAGSQQTFTSTSSPILASRFYNQLAFVGTPGDSHTWDFDDGSANVNGATATHTYTSGGTYNVMLTDTMFGWTNTCSSDTTITLNITAQPVASFGVSNSTIFAGDSIMFYNTSQGSTTCSVDFGDGTVVTSCDTLSHTYILPNTYTITLITTNTCGSDTVTQSVVVSAPTGTGYDLSEGTFSIYPNPANDYVKLELNGYRETLNVSVLGIDGRKISSQRAGAGQPVSIDVALLPAGLYLVKVATPSGSTTVQKLQINR